MKKLFTLIAFFICIKSFEQTQYGVLNAQMPTVQAGENQLTAAGLKLARLTVFWSKTFYSKTVDQYLNDGYNVAINFDYAPLPIVNNKPQPNPYKTDTILLKSQANAFFNHYKPWIKQIPEVTFENEWDNPKYHYGAVNDFCVRYKIIVTIAHQYGFKIEDGAITSTGLCEWTYYQLSEDSQAIWQAHYYNGGKNGPAFKSKVDTFINALKTIPADYINFHWYVKNDNFLKGAINTALYHYQLAIGKKVTNTNEFGAYSTSEWGQVVNDIHSAPLNYAIAYSGVNAPGNAITLSSSMLMMLSQ